MGPHGSPWAVRPASGRTARPAAGWNPPVRAVHERARAHGPRRARCPGSDGSRRPRSRRRMARELWYSTLPGRRRRTGSPFFGAPAVCRWTFTPVGSMVGTYDNYHAKLKSLTMSGSPQRGEPELTNESTVWDTSARRRDPDRPRRRPCATSRPAPAWWRARSTRWAGESPTAARLRTGRSLPR